MTPDVIVVAESGDVLDVLPPDHPFSAAALSTAEEALAALADIRAAAAPAVLLIGPGRFNIPAVVMEARRRHPEVPVVVATSEVPAVRNGPPRAMQVRSPELVAAVTSALRLARQHTRVRTTLDRLNVRLTDHTEMDVGQQRRLVLSELYLSAILEQARDGIVVTDRAGIIALWNDTAGTLFGVAPLAAAGRRLDEVVAGEAGTTLLRLVQGLSRHQRTLSHELVVDVPAHRAIELALTVVCDANGSGVAVSIVARDVTMERSLQRELEQRATALAESNRHKDEFLAVLSHELRTPLNAVLGWARLLETSPGDQQHVLRATAMITRNAELQRRLVEDLLDYARIVARNLGLELERTDVTELVKNTIAALRPSIDGRALTLTETYQPGLLALLDRDRFSQVLSNLVANAIKFTPAGGAIHITTKRREDRVEVIVADTGRGITSEFLPHVFDEFRQADGSTTRAESGLGLGLAIARRIVALHGGAIAASSAGAGKGATFTITLNVEP